VAPKKGLPLAYDTLHNNDNYNNMIDNRYYELNRANAVEPANIGLHTLEKNIAGNFETIGITQVDRDNLVFSTVRGGLLIWNFEQKKWRTVRFGYDIRIGRLSRFAYSVVNISNIPKYRQYDIQLIDIHAGRILQRLSGCNNWINCICNGGTSQTLEEMQRNGVCQYNEKYIFSGSQDNLINRHHPETGVMDCSHQMASEPKSLCWSYTYQLLCAGGKDGCIYCYDLRQPNALVMQIQAHSDYCSALLEHKGFILSGGWDKSCALWDVRKVSNGTDLTSPSRPLDLIKDFHGSVNSILPIVANQFVCIGSMDHRALIYEIDTSRFLFKRNIKSEISIHTMASFEQY